MHATSIFASILFAATGLTAPTVSNNPNFPPGTDPSTSGPGAWIKAAEWHAAPELANTSPPSTSRLVSSGAYMCNDISFTGTCTYLTPVPGNCYYIPPNDVQSDKLTSFGPDPNIACQVWEHTYEGITNVIYYPGYGDLNAIGMNDMITSFCCWWT